MPRQIYYSGDVSKPPKAGDKFIQVDWGEGSLSLNVSRGIFPDEGSRTIKRLWFPTLEKLNQAIKEERENALGRGFKAYPLSYVEAEGKPLDNPDEDQTED